MRRAQAALEFLTTYGWAFLLIVVMIGGMSYFGVLDNIGLAPESCVTSPGFACRESGIANGATNGNIKANVVNTVGESITIETEEISLDSVDGSTNCNEGVGFFVNDETGNVTVQSGAQIEISAFCDGAVIDGEFLVADISVPYKPVGKTLEKEFSVSVTQAIKKSDSVVSESDPQFIGISDDYSGLVSVGEDSTGIIRVRFTDDPQANRDIYFNSTHVWSGNIIQEKFDFYMLNSFGTTPGEISYLFYDGITVEYEIEKYKSEYFYLETSSLSGSVLVGENSEGTIRVNTSGAIYTDITFSYSQASADGITAERLMGLNCADDLNSCPTVYNNEIEYLCYSGNYITYRAFENVC